MAGPVKRVCGRDGDARVDALDRRNLEQGSGSKYGSTGAWNRRPRASRAVILDQASRCKFSAESLPSKDTGKR